MKKSNIILLVIAVVIVIICFSGFSTYNGLVDKQETATTAKTVQAYAKHEKETFEAVTKARASVGQIKLDAGSLTPEKMKQFEQAQGQLSEALGKLMVVAERYPELKANENFHSLQIQLEGTENRINEARQKYNAAVQDYNQSVRRFPNVIFAGMFGFNRMEKFEASAGAEKAPELNFN